MSQQKNTDTKSIRRWVVKTLRRVANGDNIDHSTAAPVLVKASTTAAQLAAKENDIQFFKAVAYAVVSAGDNDYIDDDWQATIAEVVETVANNGITDDSLGKIVMKNLA